MPYDTTIHRRRSIRLKGYDYSQPGAYFVTISTHLSQILFGEIVDSQMRLNNYGHIVEQEWLQTSVIRKNVELDVFAVMPDHFHGILLIFEDDAAPARDVPVTEQFGRPTVSSLPTIIRAFKSAVTKKISQVRGTDSVPVWQRGYYEHIVRNDEDLDRIREYIMGNPLTYEYRKSSGHDASCPDGHGPPCPYEN